MALRFSAIIMMLVFVPAGDSLQSWRLPNPKAASSKGFLSSSRSAFLHYDGHNDKDKNDDDDDDDNNYDETETQLKNHDADARCASANATHPWPCLLTLCKQASSSSR